MKTKATIYLLYLFCSLFSFGMYAQNITTTATSENGVCDGTATFAAPAGVDSWSWFYDDGVLIQDNGDVIGNLCPGFYSLTFNNVSGAAESLSFNIESVDGSPTDSVPSGTSCDGFMANAEPMATSSAGVCDGSLNISVQGGTAPYQFNWSNGVSSSDHFLDGLCEGDYFADILDANGCSITASAFVGVNGDSIPNGDEPCAGFDVFVNTFPASSAADCNGSMEIMVNGGLAPFTFTAPDGESTQDFMVHDLCSGPIEFEASDANGCIFQVYSHIDVEGEPSPGDSVPNDNEACADFHGYAMPVPVSQAGLCDGSLEIMVNGGVGPFEFMFSDGSVSSDGLFMDLCEGSYDVHVKDVNGCEFYAGAYVGSQGDSTAGGSCEGFYAYIIPFPTSGPDNCDGGMEIVVNGGVAPYTFIAPDGESSQELFHDGMCAGDFEFEAIDSLGCVFLVYGHIGEDGGSNPGDSIPNGDEPCAGFDVFVNTYPASSAADCNGSMEIMVNGGLAPFTFTAPDGASTQDFFVHDLCAGPVDFEASDANGCIFHVSSYVNIEGDTSPGDSIPNDNEACADFHGYAIPVPVSQAGLCDGSLEIMVNGGVGPYEFMFSDGSVSSDGLFMDLCEGSYDILVKDMNGCEFYTGVHVGSQGDSTAGGSCEGFYAYIIPYPTSGPDNCDGGMEIVVNGGIAPFTFIGPNGESTQDIFHDGMCAGDFEFEAIDSLGCVFHVMGHIGEGMDSIPNGDPNGNDCQDFYAYLETHPVTDPTICDGGVTVIVNGGFGPFEFHLPNGVVTNDPHQGDLCEGPLDILVTDLNGCHFTATGHIGFSNDSIPNDNGPCPDFYGYTIPMPVSQPGLCDGSLEVVVNGGVGPFSYQFMDGSVSDDGYFIDLCEGQYDIMVKDSNGCEFYTGGYVGSQSDTVVGSSCENFYAYTIPHPTSSPSACDGGFEIVVNGGIAPYTFFGPDGESTQDIMIEGMCPGDFEFEAVDSLGCVFHVFGHIDQGMDTVSNDPDCDGFYAYTMTMPASSETNCDGGIEVIVNGGVAPYEFHWPNGVVTNDPLMTDFCSGPNDVLVKDANGCDFFTTAFISVEVQDTTPAVSCAGFYAYTIASPISEIGSCDGQLDVVVIGGVAPYEFMLPDSSMTDDHLLMDLCEGSYNVGIKDANGCVFNSYGYVGTAVDTTNSACDIYAYTIPTPVSSDSSCDGSIEVIVSGGVAPFEYHWSDPSVSSEANIHDLCQGLFDVEVVDADGCMHHTYGYVGVGSDSVPADPCLGFSASLDVTPVTMPSECNGAIAVNILGGQGPFSVVWNDGTVDVMGLQDVCMGGYAVNITDANGCNLFLDTYVDQDTIYDDPCANVVLTSTNYSQDASSDAACDGKISAYVSGGQGPYEFIWEGSASTIYIADDLCPGSYSFLAKDIHGCEVEGSSTVGVQPAPPAPLLMGYAIPYGVTDGDTCDGGASVVVTGGVPPYNYQYSSGETTESASGLCSGLQGVIVSDQDGNALYLNFIIAAPEQTIINESFADSVAVDSLFNEPVSDCSIDYENVDSAFVSAFTMISEDSVEVTWAVIYGDTTIYITDAYFFGDGSGVYQITLQLYCPDKAVRDYLSATDKIHYISAGENEGSLTLLSNDTFNVYPNPFHQNLTVEIGNTDNTEVTVTDLSGQILSYEIYQAESFELNLNELAYGNYIITIINNNTISSEIITKY